MTAPVPWLTELRGHFDAAFAVNWPALLAELNTRFGLSADDELSTHVPESPLWFIGDVEAIRPGAWVLAISLNPHTPAPGKYEGGHTPEFYWNLWRTHNRDFFWYPRFYAPLARVAAAALGEELPRDQEPDFATTRMVFTDLCPYASRQFALRPDQAADLVANDRGFKTMAEINRLLIEQAQPAVVLVNGKDSMRAMEAVYRGKLSWREHRYPSEDNPTKILRHLQGVLDLGAGPVPVVGFPFLRKPQTHNANVEIEQLGRCIREGSSN